MVLRPWVGLGFVLSLSLSAIFLFNAPLTMAQSNETEGTVELGTTDVEIVTENPIMMPCGDCGGWPGSQEGIQFNVTTQTMVHADKVFYTANYEASPKSSRQATIEELQTAYVNMKGRLENYGKVKRTGLYVSPHWQNPDQYTGSVSLQVELNYKADAVVVEETLFFQGWSPWIDVRVTDLSAVELAVVEQLKTLMSQKRQVYEALLGHGLGNIRSLNVWSYVDSFTFDPTTEMVQVTVSVDANYFMESKVEQKTMKSKKDRK